MSSASVSAIAQRMQEAGIIAILRGLGPEQVLRAAEALLAGGVRVVEITLDSPDALTSLERLTREFDGLLPGAGTVLDGPAAGRAAERGARFVVTPVSRRQTIRAARRYGLCPVVGAFTPTEILGAYEHGAELVKIFPSAPVGPAYIRALRGPLAHVPLVPTGGINPENAADYLAAGAAALGVGGALTDGKAIAAGRYEGLTGQARALVAAVQAARAGDA